MSFLNPASFIWFALAAPIIIFYILKIRLRRVPVSTVIFWQQIFEEKQPRSIWQRLRHLLSLLMQLAFLLLLVAALTEPMFDWQLREAQRVVLVVDNSASMNATDVEPTRLDVAKQTAVQVIDDLRFGDEMAIVSGGTQPRVFCGMTGHQRTLRDAVEAVMASDGPTNVAAAVELARRLLAEHDNRKVIILSDGCYTDVTELSKSDDVQLVAVGDSTGNVGITRFQVRRSLIDPVGYEILTEVTNQSDEAVECRLEIDLGVNPVDVVPLKLEPNEVWSQVFEQTSAVGGHLVARLNRDDAFVADNQAYAILPRRERQRVVLMTEGHLFMEKVFEASRLVDLRVETELPEDAPVGAVKVFHRAVPETLPAGPVLVIEPTGTTDLWELGETLDNPIVTKQDSESPLMAHVRLENVLMPQARLLSLKDTSPQILASSLSGAPLYFVIERPEGPVVVLTVNIDKGDLPLRTAFPIMMTNVLGWFAGSKGELREALPTGAVTEVDLAQLRGQKPEVGSQISKRYLLRAPDGHTSPLLPQDDRLTLGPLTQRGVWRVEVVREEENDASASGSQPSALSLQPLLELACNVANRAESDLRRPADATLAPDAALAGLGIRPLWFYLVALAWLMVTVEWFLYQRRWIG